MTKEQAEKVLEELNSVRPEQLKGEAKRLFEAIMKIADERDELYKKVKELGKGQQTLIQSRRKWKNRYYKMKKKNKDLEKTVEQIYEDYQDIGKMVFDYSDRIELLEKQIDLMAEKLAEYEFEEMCAEAEIYHIGCPREDDLDGYMKCIKQYFENKAKVEK